MSQSPPPAPAAAPKKSPVMKIIIGILLVLLAIEAVPWAQMKLAHGKLMAELKRAETEDHRITSEMVKAILGGKKPNLTKTKRVHSGEELYEVYSYNGFIGNALEFVPPRQICIHYGVLGANAEPASREVVEVTSIVPEEILIDDQPIIKQPAVPRPADQPSDSAPEQAEPKENQESAKEDEPAKDQPTKDEPESKSAPESETPSKPTGDEAATEPAKPKDEASAESPAAPALPEN